MPVEILLYFLTEDIDRGVTVFIDNNALTIGNGVVYVLAAHYLEEFIRAGALLNKWILCCGTMKTVVSDNIKSMHYMLAYDGVLSGISVFYQNSADKTE
ncbi:hypothetical protein DSJ_01385 [Pantoea stewartii subsp. stewartii DC283]|uniref:Uncharacterized protein n=1 Tax=Pantoea stewartii subsp. stewartii DC283 TaxID=660596 RepID=A0ABN4YTJ2_PANSE|nr:hypothetical protein DSJ_01385 [Pantoea stewartii subsp. stewartii DC283]